MHSMQAVYQAMVEMDHVKEAQANAARRYGPSFAEADPGLLKTAEEYDTIGRVLARHVFADMVKQALDEEGGMTEEEKAKRLAALMGRATGAGTAAKEEEEEKKEGEEPGEEKKAAVKAAILQRMAEDPNYVSHLISKHYGG
jgi:hypothetical protein